MGGAYHPVHDRGVTPRGGMAGGGGGHASGRIRPALALILGSDSDLMMFAGGLVLLRERDQQHEPELSIVLDPSRAGNWEGHIHGRRSVLITATSRSGEAACPSCSAVSQRIHSRYVRQVADLPCSGRGVRLHLVARRSRCERPFCHQRIFAERFDPGILEPRSRRTAQRDGIVHCLGIALGGRPRASFAKRLMLPVSNDALLRTVRRRSQRPGSR